jgi:hypothetical protein
MFLDSNYTAAKTWIDKIIEMNPKSIPGWWLKAIYFREVGDTTQAKSAYDKAIQYLDTSADPAMPDPAKRPLFRAEENYRQWVGHSLAWQRSWYAP